MKILSILKEENYRGIHTAPTKQSGFPLHNLSESPLADIYNIDTKTAVQYFGHGIPEDFQTISIIKQYHNQPSKLITIYRATPNLNNININPKDWVTINKKYAVSHGESALQGQYQIIEKTVKAENIFNNGDSIHEWGYDP